MLTPKNIQDATLLSGYQHVNIMSRASGSPSFRAQKYGGKLTQAGHSWYGVMRSTALEAAQDYCNHVNGFTAITPKDIENSKRKSGYNHVGSASAGPNGGGKAPLWRAQSGKGNTHGKSNRSAESRWRGPTRTTQLDAAQDYCDYINGQQTPAAPALTYAGHGSTPSPAKSPEEAALLADLKALREPTDGSGYVYLIREKGTRYAKIGSTKGSRLASLQTGNPRMLTEVARKAVPDMLREERRIHAKFASDNKLGEWFTYSEALRKEFE